MSNKYGPNTRQVEKFLQRVAALSQAERERILSEEWLARSAYGRSNNYEVQVAAMEFYGHDHEGKMLGPAGTKLREITTGADSQFRLLAGSALMGLQLCEVMNASEFAAWYGPFAREIPIESLGEGLAPAVGPAPTLAFQRFLARVRRWENPKGIESTHDMLVTAVGGRARHDAALDAVQAFISKPGEGPLVEYEMTELSKAMDDVQSIGNEYINQGKRLRALFGATFKRDGVGDPQDYTRRANEADSRDEDFVARFRHCCIDGLFAVACLAKIPEEHVYYLYLPFEATIPIDSILP